MKFFIFLFLFGLLYKTIDAGSDTGENNETDKHRVSFSVEETFKSYRKKVKSCACSPEDVTWKEGLQDHYDGCRTASWLFRGKAYDLADTAVNSLQGCITKLIYFANVNSTIVASSSTAILKSMSRSRNLNRSSMNIIFEFEKVVLAIFEEVNEVAQKLSEHIGDVACAFTNAVTDLGTALFQYMRDFLESCRLFKCKKRVNNKPVLKQNQKLMNTLALIGATLLNECENEVTLEVYESVLVLHLIFSYLFITVPGINSCSIDVLYGRSCLISKGTIGASLSFDYALTSVTQATSEVTFPYNNSIKDLIKIFVNITMTLNTALKDLFGLFDGVEITVGEIVKNVVKGTVTVSESKAQINIVKVGF
ncbi:uncharacterized protein LOC119075468 [Bradysia coprophila]|uniref:uncharacterized protein LOC119075468 n=1 Tax=Bradysia coprophila TaxID=38358 RepID=UPI00187DC91C|nr:uncharacterized protein LOC119075468 [Bradysia coprophila]